MRKFFATATIAFSCLCSAQTETPAKADPAIYSVVLANLEAADCKAPVVSAEDKASLIRAAAAVSVPGLVIDSVITPMDYAVIADDVSSVTRLVAIGYPLTAKSLTDGGSLLHLAAWSGSGNVASFLLQQGADPGAISDLGTTPLMVAVQEGRKEIVKLLLSNGADVNARTLDGGHTVLSYSMHCKNQELVNLLLDSGAEIDPHAKSLARKFGLSLYRDEP